MKRLILATAFAALSVNAVAEPDSFQEPYPFDKSNVAQASWWARCAATHDAFGEFAAAVDKDPSIAKHYSEVGNGASTTGVVFLNMKDIKAGNMERVNEKWKDRYATMTEQRESHYTLLMVKTSVFDVDEFAEMLAADFKHCNDMHKMQDASVEFMRELIN